MRRRSLLLTPVVAALAAACGRGEEEDADRMPDAQGVRRVRYGSDPSQFGDLHLPDGEPLGLAVIVHGGFWRAQYGLDLGTPLAESLRDRGWAAWNIEYRRVGNGGGVPATLDDVRAAIAKTADFDLGVETVVGIGHSAGGHLVTWAGGDPQGGVLTHVISQAGVVDLATAAAGNLGSGAVAAFLGHPYGPDDRDVDPIAMLPIDVPVWCVHGTDDTIVPISQSEAYVAAATDAGGTAELVRVDGDHFVVIDPDSAAWARTLEILDGILA
ncbi:alpha/beta hydrolase [Nocardioides fonticola]|uniref:alpha/beta hydrolase family protein n=1 Tax=Nocardioides fonticola TaxID=450363 RepID=UPI0031CFE8AA